MTQDPWTTPGAPGGGTFIDIRQLAGRLMLIEVLNTRQQASTKKDNTGKMVSVETCNVTVLDGAPITHRIDPDTGQATDALDEAIVPGQLSATLKDYEFWGVVMARQLAGQRLVLGRGMIGERRNGNNPPFLLDTNPTEADHQRARAWFERKAQLEAGLQMQQVQPAGPQYQAPQPQYQQQPAQQFPGQAPPQQAYQQAQGNGQAPAGPNPYAPQPQQYPAPQPAADDWAN